MKISYLLVLCAAALAVCAVAAPERANPVAPVVAFAGSVDDEAKMKDAPAVIVDPYALQALWEAWAVPGRLPEVDFATQIVVPVTGKGSVLNLNAVSGDDGNLRVMGWGTKDLRPGFRYVIAVFNRAGVKAVNGTPLPEQRRIAPAAEVRGSVNDGDPYAGPTLITDAAALAKLWAACKRTDKQPEVDFAKQFVAVTTTVGSVHTAEFMLDGAGNLASMGMSTMDFRPGFRYIISVVNRDGVKSVGGNVLPAPAA